MPHNKISLCIVKYDSHSRVRYDCGSKNIFLRKLPIIVMGNYFVLFLLSANKHYILL